MINKIKNNNGITLIALVITIIVMLILAGISVSVVLNENGPIKGAVKATLYEKYSRYMEEFENSAIYADDDIFAIDDDVKKYISSISNDDLQKFMIINGDLYYCGNVDNEKEVAENLGVDISLAGASDTTELKKLLEYSENIKNNNFEEEPDKLLGDKLFDKTKENTENWCIVVDYDDNQNEIARYGNGYYYLKKGTVLTNGTVLDNDYVINYDTNIIKLLGKNSKVWSQKSPLAVGGEIPLNLDATTFENDEAWASVTKHGDVKYISESDDRKQKKSLYFDGDNDYLELKKEGLSFENGFTFEFYGNLDRLCTVDKYEGKGLGLFCRIENLFLTNFTHSMRFGYYVSKSIDEKRGMICKLNDKGERTPATSEYGIFTNTDGSVHTTNGLGYNEGENFYMTFVYRRANEIGKDEDIVEYYVNGQEIGSAAYSSDCFDNGRKYWDNDKCAFFVGCSPWGATGNVFYIKGNVYSVRLYDKALTKEELKNNMNETIKYKNSFLN